jgi:hypothetical protein
MKPNAVVLPAGQAGLVPAAAAAAVVAAAAAAVAAARHPPHGATGRS